MEYPFFPPQTVANRPTSHRRLRSGPPAGWKDGVPGCSGVSQVAAGRLGSSAGIRRSSSPAVEREPAAARRAGPAPAPRAALAVAAEEKASQKVT